MFDNFNVNLRKNEGFLTDIPCIPIPDYSQSNAPLIIKAATRNIKTRTIWNLLFSLTLQAVRIINQGAPLLGLPKYIY